MSSPSAELQKLIYDTLIADVAVAALVGDRVYDHPPSDRVFPFISFGPSDFVPDDAACITGREENLQLDVWTDDQGKAWRCKEIVDAAVAALAIPSQELNEHALVNLQITRVRVVPDPAEGISHGVINIEALIEVN